MSRLSSEIHPLFNENVLKSLFSKNIFTTLNFLSAEIKQIVAVSHLAYQDILVIRKHIINKHSALTRNGYDYYKELVQNSAIISTGIKSIDDLLEGGILSGNIVEICGAPSTGKTQFCLTVTKNGVQDLKQHIYYLDTKGDFSAKKIKQMLELAEKHSEEEIREMMSKIYIKKIRTKYELINSLYEIRNEICEGLKLRLIIIDSLPPLFYKTSTFEKDNALLNTFVNIMRFLATEYHLAIIVTNIVTFWQEGEIGEESTCQETIALGKYWLGVPNTRLMITKDLCDLKEQFTISVESSTKLPTGKMCHCGINNAGMY